jgi:hypothetical protein
MDLGICGLNNRKIKLFSVGEQLKQVGEMVTDITFPNIVDIATHPSSPIIAVSSASLSYSSGVVSTYNLKFCKLEVKLKIKKEFISD